MENKGIWTDKSNTKTNSTEEFLSVDSTTIVSRKDKLNHPEKRKYTLKPKKKKKTFILLSQNCKLLFQVLQENTRRNHKRF